MKTGYILSLFILACFALFSFQSAEAQVTYGTNQYVNAGNPGGLNTEGDAPGLSGWTNIMLGPQSANVWSPVVAIPFTFEFFGTPVTHFKASQNGLVTFDTATTVLPNHNRNLPTDSLPNMTIACYWDHFTSSPPTGTGDDIRTKVFGTAPNRQFWIKWYSFEYGTISFSYIAVVLEETSYKIHLVDQYNSTSPLLSTTVGIQFNNTTAVQFGDSTIAQGGNGSTNADNDYIEFFIRPPVDMAITGFVGLPTSVLPNTTVDVDIEVTNIGTSPAAGDTLDFYVNGIFSSSLAYAGLSGGASDTVSTSYISSTSGTDQIMAALRPVSGDSNFVNDTLRASVAIDTVYSLPYLQDFEAGIVGTPGTLPPHWRNEPGDDFDWYVDAAGTPSSGTGPAVDHTLGTSAGKYMFTESSSPNFPNKVANLTSPYINLTGTVNPGVEFWFHMYGATMGELHVDVWASGNWTNDVRSPLVGQFQTASTDPWLRAGVDLTQFAGQLIKVRFRGITGPSFTSDMAIDDVKFDELDSLAFPYEIQARRVETPLLTKMPLTQSGIVSAVNFSGTFSNTGPSDVGDINVAVVNATTVFSNSITGVAMPGFRDSTFSLGQWNAAATPADMYTILMYSSNFAGANDTATAMLELGETMGYDNGNHTNSIAHSSTLRNLIGARFTLTDADTLTSVTMMITSSTVLTDSFAVDLYTSVNDTPGTAITRIYRGTFGDFAPLPALVTFLAPSGIPLPAGNFYAMLDMDTPSSASFPIGADNTGLGSSRIPRRFIFMSGTSDWLFFEDAGNAVFRTFIPIIRTGFQESGEIHDYAVSSVDGDACLIVGTATDVLAVVDNRGNQAETAVTVEFLDNGVVVGNTSVSLQPGADTTVTFSFTPTNAGVRFLSVVSRLTGDANPGNDSSWIAVRVLPAGPDLVFQDNFSDTTFTSANWTVTNDGGDGIWMVYTEPYPNLYTLPITSAGNVFSADADATGSGTTTLTTASISLDLSTYESVTLDFDSDWRHIDAQDTARVKVSPDGGTTWITVLEAAGVSHRDTHYTLNLSSHIAMSANAIIAFQSIQPGWDWWWTIDNVCVTGTVPPTPPAKLLITEFVVTPTGGEFIEIYNPTLEVVDLTDYYLTDATFANGGTYYYNIVRDTLFGGGGFGDFHSRFPAGSSITPAEYQTVALNGNADFFGAYGVNPTYEIDQVEFATGGTDTIPNMLEVRPGSIYGADSTHNPGLTNGDEVIILYHWDGVSDLVSDVDYVLYNSLSPVPNDEAVDKSGILIDGPDPDTLRSAYLDDVPVDSQASAPSHPFGQSVHRIDFNEGSQISSGGNGVTGANEMSEDLNNTFTNLSVPSPNAPYQPIVGVAGGSGIPKTFQLAQNYPNPFNPTTRIAYALPKESFVTLTVYNVLGQEVVRLVNEEHAAGFFTVAWDGRNSLGHAVGSGLYFYRIEARPINGSDGFLQVKKMLYLK